MNILALLFAVAANVVTVTPNEVVGPAAPDLWGIFFEDIDLSLDGGIYAEMVRNPSFEHYEINDWTQGLPLEYWHPIGQPEMQVWTKDGISKANARSMRVTAEKDEGVWNEGFFGYGVEKGKSYNLSVCLKGNTAPIEVSLERWGEPPLAKAIIPPQAGGGGFSPARSTWTTNTLTLVASDTDAHARLAFRALGDMTFQMDCVSLFPAETYGTSGLFRKDLMEKLAALKPKFVRFPGGCWVEGDVMAEAFRWKETLKPRWERKPKYNLWKYWSSNCVGFYEYLLLCEELHAKPLYCINCGMSHKENVPLEKMDEYVQDALDVIEFCNGSVTSKWGRVRAELGHPAPFNLEYLQIGNENKNKAYEERYPLIADAVRAKYPEIKLIACRFNYDLKCRPVEIEDDHFYKSADWFLTTGRTFFDKGTRRNDIPVFVGEYATQKQIGRWGDLRGAIAEACFMIGMERNPDKVKLAAYAPLFANYEHSNWTPNLIYVSTLASFASPSWNVQKLFAENAGDTVVKCDVSTDRLTADAVVKGDETIVKVVNGTHEARPVTIKVPGHTARRILFGGLSDGKAHNTLANPDALKESVSEVAVKDGQIEDHLPPFSLVVFRVR